MDSQTRTSKFATLRLCKDIRHRKPIAFCSLTIYTSLKQGVSCSLPRRMHHTSVRLALAALLSFTAGSPIHMLFGRHASFIAFRGISIERGTYSVQLSYVLSFGATASLPSVEPRAGQQVCRLLIGTMLIIDVGSGSFQRYGGYPFLPLTHTILYALRPLHRDSRPERSNIPC
jgi:hypothetical protein